MAPAIPPHPSILLLTRLFSLRDGASPFTLVLDSVEQVGRPVVTRFLEGRKASKTKIIYISYETPNSPRGVDVFIRARRKSINDLRRDIGFASQDAIPPYHRYSPLSGIFPRHQPSPLPLQPPLPPDISPRNLSHGHAPPSLFPDIAIRPCSIDDAQIPRYRNPDPPLPPTNPGQKAGPRQIPARARVWSRGGKRRRADRHGG
ncbi:MAG: hypothetical protein Q9214_000933 [Letrouitia sp. 1 TL-2023]